MPCPAARPHPRPGKNVPDRAARARAVADRLHSAAIHLLRRLRAADAASGLTASRLSALSVVVFGGPQTITALAAAEQVRLPTMTRLVQGLERDGLVTRAPDPRDRRRVVVRATAPAPRRLPDAPPRRADQPA